MTQPPPAEPPGSPDDDGSPGQVPPFTPPTPPPNPGADPGVNPGSRVPGDYPPYPAPYGAPAGPQNPYGGGTTDCYQPIDSGGMSSTATVVLGVVLGLVGGFVLWFVAAFLLLVTVTNASSDGNATTFFFLSAIAPLLVPAPLLFWKATRPWAVGLLMGTAVVSIGHAGLCSSIINGVDGGAA